LTLDTAQARRPFCKLVWEDDERKKHCHDDYEKRVAGCQKPEIGTCWLGVHNVACPVKDEDDFQITLVGGEFRVREMREEAEKRFEEFLAKQPPKQQEKFREAWRQIPEVSQEDALGYKLRELKSAGFGYVQAIKQRSDFRYMTGLAAHDFIVALQALIAEVEVLKIELGDAFNIGQKWQRRFEGIIKMCEEHNKALETKLEEDKARYRFAYKSISKMIHETIETFSPKAKKRWIEFKTRLEQSVDESGKHQVIRVRMDRVSLGKALNNVIDNAVKYSADGTPTHPKYVEVSGRLRTLKNVPGYNIIIKNEGVGINKDELESVFEPGYQGKQRFEKGISGYGMGLANVKQCVEEHGGQVSMHSRPYEKDTWLTTIAIWLPLHGPGKGK
jgi:signal transduction histidine kinase